MSTKQIYTFLREKGFQLRSLNYPLYRMIRGGCEPLVILLHRKLANQNHLNPTDEMKAASEFFGQESVRKRISDIKSWLEDEESRIIYDTMIQFRCTQDYKTLSRISEIKTSTQYFDNEFFQYDNGECLIDCGAFDGDTIEAFHYQMKKRGIKHIRVVAFEPDAGNCERLRRNQKGVVVINSGVWSKNVTLRFATGGNSLSRMLEDGEKPKKGETVSSVDVRSIDSCRECDKATLIKMDIEGSEMGALIGAEQLIKKRKPKLAICIYHSDEDMVRIAEWVKESVPEYRLWIRQHMDTQSETVLYAML